MTAVESKQRKVWHCQKHEKLQKCLKNYILLYSYIHFVVCNKIYTFDFILIEFDFARNFSSVFLLKYCARLLVFQKRFDYFFLSLSNVYNGVFLAFCKVLHHRCLTGFWIRFCTIIFSFNHLRHNASKWSDIL